ncbi:tripartite tricarboxylate transporter substrate binding protein [Ramlibacter sp. AW1]|uniref:Tripartite tricarboxylate transporter substrate binding protein n=1 Tax=Ramlibacter aurantiacus TaxID=2801330 RepID=A0A937D4G5_9BURK|nr:tripartite tricarboxylate transporter substrate binding protein [Ramlibacter aurantiacus]MBL0420307.1 tripartite tricarboxylate transporter substrate binding protein [Ramlibacter aurantiacus]
MAFEATRRDLMRLALGATTAACAPLTLAQGAAGSWPARPVNLIVPFPAGGGTDAFARPLAAQFAKQTGRQLVVENRGGAGGTVGASLAARAAPDGYTLFMGAVHHAIAPSMYPKLDYDLEKDFVPLMVLANVPQVLVVNPRNLPVADFKEFLATVRKSPGRYNYGSAGTGTSHHLAGELFKQQSQTFIIHIPYTGAGPALRDLVGGQVDMMFDGLGSSAAHIKGGRIKALMVSGNRRSPAFPDVPSAAEVGFPDYTVSTWYALWAPKGTPQDVQTRVIEEMRKTLAADEIKTVWAGQGAEVPNLNQQQFASHINSEIKRWSAVVKAAGAKLD